MKWAKRQFSALALLAASLAASPALANGQASGSFQVVASVPMACWVDHTIAADAARDERGLVTEGCNNSGGYVVSVGHRPLAPSEQAELHYGDSVINLSGGPLQEVNREYGPTVQNIAYGFGAVSLESPLTLSLTIQPL